jgi:hypothetical protein
VADMNLSYEQLALAAAQMRTATEQVDAELTRVKASSKNSFRTAM